MSSEKHMEQARELAKELSDGICGCNDCLTIIAAALAKVEAETREAWQPIETAPKDGTRFLAFQSSEHFDCWWYVSDYGDEAYWMDHADSEPAPTHWMPLPAPPAILAEGEKPHAGGGDG